MQPSHATRSPQRRIRRSAASILLLAAALFPTLSRGSFITWTLGPPQAPLPQCPPPGFSAVPNLNLTAYTAAPWYAQLQMPISFQGEDPTQYLYCVKAEYLRLPPSDPRVQAANRALAPSQQYSDFYETSEYYDNNNPQAGVITGSQSRRGSVPVYQVLNYATKGQVNGPPVGTSLMTSEGRALNAPLVPEDLLALPDPSAAGTPTATSTLLVGPSGYLNSLLSFNWRLGWGQYWVVAVMSSNDTRIGYDWAIVSGGPPEFASPGGCVTTPPMQVPVGQSPASDFLAWMGVTMQNKAARVESMTHGSSRGLWLMSRKPVDPQGAREMLRTARDLGYDTSVLMPVQQQGCTYGAPSPPAAAPPMNASQAQPVPIQPNQPQVQRRPRTPNGSSAVPVPP